MAAGEGIGLIVYAVGSTTDVLDGYLARSWKAESRVGAFLDPLADKALILGTAWALVVAGDFLCGWRDVSLSGTSRCRA